MATFFQPAAGGKVVTPQRFLSLQFYHWIMNGLHRTTPYLLCALLVILSGCTLPSIGDARYRNGEISVNLTGTGGNADARVQVTVYQIKDLHQREYLVVTSPVVLKNNEHEIYLPAQLEPGSYKLSIYLIQNGERKTAVIRDIVV